MKVIDMFFIKGRGPVSIIDKLPAELEVGMYVESGALSWRITGLETHAMARRHTNGQSAGLLLVGKNPPPAVGTELTLCSRSSDG